MATRRLPNSRSSVIRTLTMAGDQYLATPNPADRAISAAVYAQINRTDPTSLLSRLINESSESDNALAAQAPLSSVTSQKAQRLTMCVSHFHQVLDLGIAREKWTAGVRAYYGRDVSNPVLPDLSNYEAVKDAADRVVNGESARATAEGSGYIAMSNPSASEVGTALTQFTTAWSASKAAQTATDLSLEDVQALYPEAQALAVDICDTVEFFYRKDPQASSFRRKCKRWGVVYIYAAGESDDNAPSKPILNVVWDAVISKVVATFFANDAVSFRLERSDDGVNFSNDGDATSPAQRGDMAPGTYYYRVVAVNDVGETASDAVQVVVP